MTDEQFSKHWIARHDGDDGLKTTRPYSPLDLSWKAIRAYHEHITYYDRKPGCDSHVHVSEIED